jgi:AraC-like DNA-binding protein
MLSGYSVAGFLGGMALDFLDEHALPAPFLRSWLHGWCPEGRVAWEDWLQCHRLLAEISPVAATGIHVGKHLKPSHMSFFGELVSHCRTLGESLLYLQRYQRLIYDGNPSLVMLKGNDVVVSWGRGHGPVSQSTDDVALSMFVGMSWRLAGPDFQPLEVRVSGDPGRDLSPYREYFGCDVRHGGDQLLVRFSQQAMFLPVQGADPARIAWLEQAAERQLNDALSVDIFSCRLDGVLASLLSRRACSLSAAADGMGITVRSLQQELSRRDLVFPAAVDRCRSTLARHYLQQHELSLGEVSARLGFSEQSAFNRAFRRWYGATPQAFRGKPAAVGQGDHGILYEASAGRGA